MLPQEIEVYAEQDLAYNYRALLFAIKNKWQITADYALFKMGLEVEGRRGGLNRQVKKYMPADIDYIRTEFNNGRTWRSLAEEYKVSIPRIRKIAGYVTRRKG